MVAINELTFSGLMIAKSASHIIAQVTIDGEVQIDWDCVDEVLADPNSDPSTVIYARLMRACRDGTWKPMRAASSTP